MPQEGVHNLTVSEQLPLQGKNLAERSRKRLPAWLATAAAARPAPATGSPSAATAGAEAIATASAARSESTIRLRPCFVYVDRSSIQAGTVQSSNRLVRFPLVFHFHKREAARTARVPVSHDPRAVHHAVALEQAPYRFFRRIKAQVTYENVLHSSRSSSQFESGANQGRKQRPDWRKLSNALQLYHERCHLGSWENC